MFKTREGLIQMERACDVSPVSRVWRSMDIELNFDLEGMAKHLHLEKDSEEHEEFAAMLEKAASFAKPKAFFREDFVEDVSSQGASFGGETFISAMLAEKLSKGDKVFPYIISCGRELGEIQFDHDDPLLSFWFESIKAQALDAAFKALEAKLLPLCGKANLNWLEPTDTDAWSIRGLKELFRLFPAMDQISLSEYMFMEPNKSRAGIFIGSDKKYLNCDHCAMRGKCQESCSLQNACK